MGQHLVICELAGTGFESDLDPVYADRSFQPAIPASFNLPISRAAVDPSIDMENGYFAAWITCPQSVLAQLVSLGHVVTVIHEGSGRRVMAKLTNEQKKVHEDKVDKEIKKLAKRDGRTKLFNDEKRRKGLR